MQAALHSLYIALGAAIGANLRFWISTLADSKTQAFPWPTLLINVLGSAVLGAFSATALLKGWGWQSKAFFAVGLCGGFTTFSTFSYEVIDTYYERSWKLAGLYALLSFVLCVGGCFLGAHFARTALQHSAAPGSPFAEEAVAE